MSDMLAPIAPAFDLETLVRAAAAEESGLWDLSRAKLHADGWENAVLETGDGWILRFPRDEEVDFEQEVAMLQHLEGRLLVRTPIVEWIGQKTRFAAYRKLTGAAFDRERYASATEFQREALASSLARFLAAMHDSMDEVEEAELEVELLDHEPTLAAGGQGDALAARVALETRRGPDRPVRDDVGRRQRARPERLAAQRLSHREHGPGRAGGELTGVWDFSNVQIGVPTFDFRYFDGAPRDLLERMAGHYQMLTQRPIDVRAAVVANRMEDLFDVLQTRRMDLFDARTARWAAADAGQ